MANELLEILGLYYDSFEEQLLKEAEQYKTIGINAEITLKSIEKYSYSVSYNYKFTGGGVSYDKQYSYNFVEFLNQISPNFVLTLPEEGIPISSQDCFKTVCNTHCKTLYSQDMNTSFEAILASYLNTLGATPNKYSVQIQITRIPNIDYVKKYCARHRCANQFTYRQFSHRPNLYTPKQLAEHLLNNKYTVYGYKYVRPYSFKGTLKNNIYHLNKNTALFIITYLYGKKLNASINFKELGHFLANQPFTDFGLRDVQKIGTLCDICSKEPKDIKTLYDSLVTVLPPVVDLKKWKKQLEVRQEAIMPQG